MEYDDFQLLRDSQIEKMAKEYSRKLKSKGFVFVRLNDEDEVYNSLLQNFKTAMNNFFSYINVFINNAGNIKLKNKIKIIKLEVENLLIEYPYQTHKVKLKNYYDALNHIDNEIINMIKYLIQMETFDKYGNKLKVILKLCEIAKSVFGLLIRN